MIYMRTLMVKVKCKFTLNLLAAVWSDLEVIKLEYNLKLKIKRNDWLFADKCPQAANHCALI